MFALKLLLAIATIGLALPAQAAPAPIVFDFEDGLQGWELHAGPRRFPTSLLGGEWAIFVDVAGFGGISMRVEELQAVGAVTFDQLIIAGPDSSIQVIRDVEGVIFIGVPVGAPPIRVIALIDNITFHPVPEPSSWLLLSLGIAGMVVTRRKLVSRS